MRRFPLRACIVAATLGITPPSAAQGIDGYVTLLGDLLPAVELEVGDRRAVTELRARVFAERRFEIGRIRLTTAGFADGLVADRVTGNVSHAGIVRPQELHLEASWPKADLRVGLTRVTWGRLDEFLPTDVVNPQDLTRFFLEGRAEGRMPVAMVRGRLMPSDRFTFEAIYVPVFRRGRFDQLEEDTSPFNVVRQSTSRAKAAGPATTLANSQGGGRVNVTTGRVDWAISAYRGFESLPVYQLAVERFPRYTMLGADFETVRGAWGLRGEFAGFVERTLQAVDAPVGAKGKVTEAGLGVDRKTGAYRVSATVLVTKRWADAEDGLSFSGIRPTFDRTDVTLVAALDRSLARATRTLRLFAVYNPGEGSAFARVISTFHLRDNVAFDASGGLFAGHGVDALSRLRTRDFIYGRLKVFF